VLKITLWDDPILKKIAEPVPDSAFGLKLELFGRDMIETMEANNGIGLAAPQVGISERIFVMSFPDHTDLDPIIVVNPRIRYLGSALYEQEGCLSLPGLYEQVARSSEITMEYQDPLTGRWKADLESLTPSEATLKNWDARVAAHELDHLDGWMFFDRMSRQMRKALLQRWEKTKHPRLSKTSRPLVLPL